MRVFKQDQNPDLQKRTLLGVPGIEPRLGLTQDLPGTPDPSVIFQLGARPP